jgi:hypothetical protein
MAPSTTRGAEEREPTTSTDKRFQPESLSELQEAAGADGREGEGVAEFDSITSASNYTD